MKVTPTGIPDVMVIEPVFFRDPRGFFMETWNRKRFAEHGLDVDFVQDNHSMSQRGVLRGLHYQIEQAQGKLVHVISGEVFDVAVDLRKSSPTFGKWTGIRLTAENRKIFWIPPGFAHGFYAIGENTQFLYKCTDFYAPRHERTIRWDDPDLGIEWPLVHGLPPVVSEKDSQGSYFRDADHYP